MVINNKKILYLLCQLIRPLIYIVYNTTYKLYINSGDVMLILGGENFLYKTKYPFLSWTGTSFLYAAYTLFKNTPARREDYIEVAKTSTFPLKFVSHR